MKERVQLFLVRKWMDSTKQADSLDISTYVDMWIGDEVFMSEYNDIPLTDNSVDDFVYEPEEY